MKKTLKTETFINSAGETVEYTIGSGNVFADLELPDAEELFLKSQLISQISTIVRERGWNQAQAAAATGLTQPKISNLLRGRIGGFSVEKLFSVLNRLGCDVEVRVKPPKAKSPGQTRAVLKVA